MSLAIYKELRTRLEEDPNTCLWSLATWKVPAAKHQRKPVPPPPRTKPLQNFSLRSMTLFSFSSQRKALKLFDNHSSKKEEGWLRILFIYQVISRLLECKHQSVCGPAWLGWLKLLLPSRRREKCPCLLWSHNGLQDRGRLLLAGVTTSLRIKQRLWCLWLLFYWKERIKHKQTGGHMD